MLNFTAIDLQLYKIFKITRVLFFGTQCRWGLIFSSDVTKGQRADGSLTGWLKPGTHWQQSRPYRQQSWTYTVTIDFVADLLPISATVDFQQSRPRWIQLCRQCVPGLSEPRRLSSVIFRQLSIKLFLHCQVKPDFDKTWQEYQLRGCKL